jgi:hypothetical protein
LELESATLTEHFKEVFNAGFRRFTNNSCSGLIRSRGRPLNELLLQLSQQTVGVSLQLFHGVTTKPLNKTVGQVL